MIYRVISTLPHGKDRIEMKWDLGDAVQLAKERARESRYRKVVVTNPIFEELWSSDNPDLVPEPITPAEKTPILKKLVRAFKRGG